MERKKGNEEKDLMGKVDKAFDEMMQDVRSMVKDRKHEQKKR